MNKTSLLKNFIICMAILSIVLIGAIIYIFLNTTNPVKTAIRTATENASPIPTETVKQRINIPVSKSKAASDAIVTQPELESLLLSTNSLQVVPPGDKMDTQLDLLNAINSTDLKEYKSLYKVQVNSILKTFIDTQNFINVLKLPLGYTCNKPINISTIISYLNTQLSKIDTAGTLEQAQQLDKDTLVNIQSNKLDDSIQTYLSCGIESNLDAYETLITYLKNQNIDFADNSNAAKLEEAVKRGEDKYKLANRNIEFSNLLSDIKNYNIYLKDLESKLYKTAI